MMGSAPGVSGQDVGDTKVVVDRIATGKDYLVDGVEAAGQSAAKTETTALLKDGLNYLDEKAENAY